MLSITRFLIPQEIKKKNKNAQRNPDKFANH